MATLWVSNITYLPLANSTWAYPCAFQDVCTKHVVGWQARAGILDVRGHQRLAASPAGPTARPLG